MQRCPDEDQILAFTDGTLDTTSATELESHVDGCDRCGALLAALGKLASSPPQGARPDELPVRRHGVQGVTGAAGAGGAAGAARHEKTPDFGPDSGTDVDALGRPLAGPHIDDCQLDDIDDLDRLDDRDASPLPFDDLLRRGDGIGRYVVLQPLGVGGMGVVYAAYDPELDRKVAVKLVQTAQLVVESGHSKAMVIREAQAIARIAHPNVVAVHDVGSIAEHVFIAMEFIEGQTLREWARHNARPSPERPWPEVGDQIVDLLLQAGRGLAAAHKAGVVHRDLKPGNVAVGRDGRVRVLDFGLAHLRDKTIVPTSVLERADALWTRDRDAEATDGVLAGTPAYMSPEQLAGQTADARSDQFSFCVTAYEALYGDRPFAGTTVDELARALHDGTIEDAPRSSPVPSRLRAVLLRGLAREPAERWPSMDALLTEMARATVTRRRWPVVAALAAFAALAVLAAALALLGDRGETRPVISERCTRSDLEGAEPWNDRQRVAVERAMRATGVDFADDSWRRVSARLEPYATRWADAYRDACRTPATRPAHPIASHLSITGASAERRIACLARRGRHLRALIAELSEVDATSITRAVAAVDALPAIDSCADPVYLAAQVLPPEEIGTARPVEALLDGLARVTVMMHLGRIAPAFAETRTLHGDATRAGYAPLIAEVGLRLGSLHRHRGAFDDAEAELTEAYFMARRTEHRLAAAAAAAELVGLVGATRGRHDEALLWARHARVELAELDSEPANARLLHDLGRISAIRGDLDRALREYRGALAVYSRSDPLDPGPFASESDAAPDTVHAVPVLLAMGRVLLRQEQHGDAGQMYRRASSLVESTLGADHPAAAAPLIGLARIDLHRGRAENARAFAERAIGLQERAPGDSLELAEAHFVLAQALLASGAPRQRALTLARSAHADHRALATAAPAPGSRQDRATTHRARLGADEIAAWLRAHRAGDRSPTAPTPATP